MVIRKLFDIKQTTTVQDYVDHFSKLVDLLVTYEHTTHPLYYTMSLSMVFVMILSSSSLYNVLGISILLVLWNYCRKWRTPRRDETLSMEMCPGMIGPFCNLPTGQKNHWLPLPRIQRPHLIARWPPYVLIAVLGPYASTV
jgi:hypothetical protein